MGIKAILKDPKLCEPKILATRMVPIAEMKEESILPIIKIMLPLADTWIMSENFFSKPFPNYCKLLGDKEYGL